MTQTVTAQDARNKFAGILNMAAYGQNNIVITHFNQPKAVVMGYQEYQRLINPQFRFTTQEWNKGFTVFDQIRAKNKTIPPQQITQGIAQAVAAVRKLKRV